MYITRIYLYIHTFCFVRNRTKPLAQKWTTVVLAVRGSPCLRLKMAVGKLQYVRCKSKPVHGPRPIWNTSAKVTYLPIRMNQRVPSEDERSPGGGSQRSSVNSLHSTPMIQSMSSANTSLQSLCSTERFHRCWRVSCWRQNWHCRKQLL